MNDLASDSGGDGSCEPGPWPGRALFIARMSGFVHKEASFHSSRCALDVQLWATRVAHLE